jgi:hypothetical protein
MKWSLTILCLMTISSCASGDFSYKDHCSKESYSRVKKANALEKKQRRGEASKLEEEIISHTKLLNRDYETTLKPLMFECLAESERAGNKQIYSICTVAEVNLKGKLSFLEVDDTANFLEPKLKQCLMSRMQSFNYSRYPGVTAIQAITMDLDP